MSFLSLFPMPPVVLPRRMRDYIAFHRPFRNQETTKADSDGCESAQTFRTREERLEAQAIANPNHSSLEDARPNRPANIELPREGSLSSGLSTPSSVSSTDLEKFEQAVEEWKPQKKEWFIMISLSIISFMVALDATILVTVLPVSQLCSRNCKYTHY